MLSKDRNCGFGQEAGGNSRGREFYSLGSHSWKSLLLLSDKPYLTKNRHTEKASASWSQPLGTFIWIWVIL